LEYHESGQIKIDIDWEEDEKHGRETEYFEDGKIKIDIDWVEG